MEDAAVIERRRAHERAEIREALAMSRARESIDRLLGEELIAAAREAVDGWNWHPRTHARWRERMQRAMNRLEELVGSAHE